ncbi:MAG: dihydrolipoyl dehydrogenase [Elusimicrobia bacterium RIFCSPLOWO2_02_FULL_39_32]|nr:MAG: dihydrolipoyl dehydrogenase [Elusimicrobia bacterium RIFCSPHIGHO2_02_FULL_39_36]OGR91807.1 MAG: dihydrolipoyl dehydrogenase [Elusimicrobia bacterium RIFCSPLOWO2_02_FULL_39_32]OGR98466.1 MAG: dihydrolipoyl dehydrogenase [Elusimicrobia bacterium RIFCSPLOWO2_12_FULL_39_28]
MIKVNLVIIGGGPAGETAARAAAKKNARIHLIEKEFVGGLCLNRGCIPSKTLLSFGKKLFLFRNTFKTQAALTFPFGSLQNELWQEIKKEKERIVAFLRSSLEKQIKTHGVEIISGKAQFSSPQEIMVKSLKEEKRITFDKAIIAVGSKPFFPPPFDKIEKELLDSDKVFDLTNLPKRILIVGGGAIGCEFACFFKELGSEIFLIEKTKALLPGEDPQIVNSLARSFEKRGIKIYTSLTAIEILKTNSFWTVTLSDHSKIEVDQILVCAGRIPNCSELSLEKAQIKYSHKGIEVNSNLETSNPNVYAVGDVNGLSLLAHAGSKQGEIAANNALGEKQIYNENLIPRCLYTWPEVASVGMWKKDADHLKIETESHRSFFQGLGRAQAEGETEGFIQIVCEKKNGKIIGAQIIGPHATEMIHIFSIAIDKKMNKEELKNIIFAHPTYSEGIKVALER